MPLADIAQDIGLSNAPPPNTDRTSQKATIAPPQKTIAPPKKTIAPPKRTIGVSSRSPTINRPTNWMIARPSPLVFAQHPQSDRSLQPSVALKLRVNVPISEILGKITEPLIPRLP